MYVIHNDLCLGPSHIELKSSSGAGNHCGDKLGLYKIHEIEGNEEQLVYRQLHDTDETHFYLYRYSSNMAHC